MSSLMLMTGKQRLSQVGTCICLSFQSVRRPAFSRTPKAALREISTGEALAQFARRRKIPTLTGENTDHQQLLLGQSQLAESKLLDLQRRKEEREMITVPLHLERRLALKLEKDNTKVAIRQKIIDSSREGRKSQITIHCKRPEFNHYVGQSYSTKKDTPLASGAWRNRKSTGDFFTLYPGFKRQAPFYMTGAEAMTFKDLGINEAVCNNLKSLGIDTPTHIQVFGIPQILKGKQTAVAAETGCGKTLVYLLPIIMQTLEDRRYKVRPKPGHPTSIILVPSRELADQVYQVATNLTYNLDISVKLLQGGSLGSKMKNPPKTQGVDILIATTNALKVLTSAGVYGTSKLLHVVLDEADTLLDDSFFPELVAPFLNRLPFDDLQRQLQLTLVSATMPKNLESTLKEVIKIDNLYSCTTPGLHHLMPHVPQTFLRMGKSKKVDKIKEIVAKDFKNKVPVMIFCNKHETCDWLSRYLNEEGFDCVSAHGRMPLKYRLGRIEAYQRGEINILISTDLASRGIDTIRTQHVINYEFPLFIADYIHRCGRTGRVGSEKQCRVTNFISRMGEVNAVNEIEHSVRKEKVLPHVDANIKKLYGTWYGEYKEIEPINDENDKQETSEEKELDEMERSQQSQ
ncbi:unnamed protein product [Orchesella dallaii]|uniref:RNA helicase n=1 Tax=Orchesella dallaii TaxID=48710 RepID=A0ABP1QW31_9HEXA